MYSIWFLVEKMANAHAMRAFVTQFSRCTYFCTVVHISFSLFLFLDVSLRCLSRCAHRHVDVMCVVTFRLVAEVVEADHRLSCLLLHLGYSNSRRAYWIHCENDSWNERTLRRVSAPIMGGRLTFVCRVGRT